MKPKKKEKKTPCGKLPKPACSAVCRTCIRSLRPPQPPALLATTSPTHPPPGGQGKKGNEEDMGATSAGKASFLALPLGGLFSHCSVRIRGLSARCMQVGSLGAQRRLVRLHLSCKKAWDRGRSNGACSRPVVFPIDLGARGFFYFAENSGLAIAICELKLRSVRFFGSSYDDVGIPKLKRFGGKS